MSVAESTSTRPRRGPAAALGLAAVTPGALVLAAALPILFLHVRFQPGVRIPLGSTHVGFELSDAAVLVVFAAALREGVHAGFDRLRPALPIWIAASALLLWVGVGVLHPLLWQDGYSWLRHAVTAAKYGEYALLAVAAPLVLRSRDDWELVLRVAVAWSVFATAVGIAQFAGLDVFEAGDAGYRQNSFLGELDFAALSGLSLAVGLSALVFSRRRLGWIGIVSGGLGIVIAGSTAGLVGLLAGCAGLLYVAHRRGVLVRRDVVATVLVAALVSTGVFALRANDFDQFLGFLGIKREQSTDRANVQTYAHRTLLVYIGYRIWLEHPIAGAGWQASGEQSAYGPVLPTAHREFPDEPDIAFPSPRHEYGVQNAYVQALADLGVIGLLLWVAAFAAGLFVALRANAPPSAVAVFALLLALGLWGAQGLVAGLPLDALTWLGLGLAATAAAAEAGGN